VEARADVAEARERLCTGLSLSQTLVVVMGRAHHGQQYQYTYHDKSGQCRGSCSILLRVGFQRLPFPHFARSLI
jgi:hypothetical protein